jgi:hypothetical protein
MTTANNSKIPDPGLYLGVLQALMEREIVAEERLDSVLAEIETSEVDPDDERARVAEAVGLLHALPLPADALARVERLDFDGGNDIYMLIEQVLEIETGGEADYYEVGSLQGIGALTSLVSLDLDGHGYRSAALDLSPLAGHPTLASLHLTGRCTHAAVLASLPALKQLRASASDLDEPGVLARLRERGVEILGD